MPSSRDDCLVESENVKPSLGNDGRFCVCCKPHTVDEDWLSRQEAKRQPGH